MLNRVLSAAKPRINYLLHAGRIRNPYRKLGLSNYDYLKIDKRLVWAPDSVSVFGRSISYPGGYWLLYSLNEIFLEEVYKFDSPNKSPLIIDCGANIGLSVIYFKRMFADARIIAYEPDPVIFNTLRHNIEQFNYSGVELINKAVWVGDTELEFYSEGTLGGRIDQAPDNGTMVRVKTERLKDQLTQRVDFLKVDIEGAEYEVLLDCGHQLSNVDKMFFEYHGDRNKKGRNLEDILKVVSSAGFRYYIKESYPIVRLPFVEKGPDNFFDLLLNVFCYRP